MAIDMTSILYYASWFCLISGALLVLTSAVGMLRMPDFYTRLHPSSINDTMGLLLIMAGILLQVDFGLVSIKIFILVLFSMITSATASHALAKAALFSGVKPFGEMKSLSEVLAEEKINKSKVDKISNSDK